MVALLYMFRSALNIYSSKEYIYIMDDALSFFFFFFWVRWMFFHYSTYMFTCALNIYV